MSVHRCSRTEPSGLQVVAGARSHHLRDLFLFSLALRSTRRSILEAKFDFERAMMALMSLRGPSLV